MRAFIRGSDGWRAERWARIVAELVAVDHLRAFARQSRAMGDRFFMRAAYRSARLRLKVVRAGADPTLDVG